ncbi:hypothetical protein CLU79DRAFT_690157, partial [Phycomyces nitens]
VNKVIAPDIQKSTVPTSSAIQGKLKDAEKFRMLANAAAILYEEFGSILADPSYEDHPLLDSMQAFEERTRQSTVFIYAAAVSAEDDVKKCLILDCKHVNALVQVQHFKMEGVPALQDILRKGLFMTKIDLKDAYLVVPVHEESHCFLSF